jgi:DnaJ-class molecular chaperone
MKMKQYHPDLYATAKPEVRQFAEEKCKVINDAYVYLMDHHSKNPNI